MGTRSMTIVKDRSGEVKIAKYNQWDGYIQGLGKDILKFLQETPDFEKFLKKLRFLDDEFDKDFIERFNTSPTKKEKDWYNKFISRDLGVNLLYNILSDANCGVTLHNEICLKNKPYIEYVYTIDYSQNMFVVEIRRDRKRYFIPLDNLPNSDDSFYKIFES